MVRKKIDFHSLFTPNFLPRKILRGKAGSGLRFGERRQFAIRRACQFLKGPQSGPFHHHKTRSTDDYGFVAPCWLTLRTYLIPQAAS